MFCKDLVSNDVPILQMSDSPDKVLDILDYSEYKALPVVDEHGMYIGIINEDIAMDMQERSVESIIAYTFPLPKFAVNENDHELDAGMHVTVNGLRVVPVINNSGFYLGSITLDSLIFSIGVGTQARANGGIVVIESEPRNYSLSKIVSVFENEGIKVLSTLMTTNEDGNSIITLKLNSHDLSSPVSTLERLNYNVIEVRTKGTTVDDVEYNFQSLMKYLNI